MGRNGGIWETGEKCPNLGQKLREEWGKAKSRFCLKARVANRDEKLKVWAILGGKGGIWKWGIKWAIWVKGGERSGESKSADGASTSLCPLRMVNGVKTRRIGQVWVEKEGIGKRGEKQRI